MKRKITFLTALALTFVFNAIAQPLVTLINQGPINGKLIGYPVTGTFNHSAPGKNLNWDYSNVAVGAEEWYYKNIGYNGLSSTMKSLYPTGTHATSLYFQGTYYADFVFKINAGAKIMLGQGNNVITPADTQLVYPHAYSEKHGKLTYDSYGTLTTPFGTYNNVVRICRDSGTKLDYLFYTFSLYEDIHMTYSVDKATGKISAPYFCKSTTAGISEKEINNSKLSLSPNPSKGTFSVIWEGGDAEVSISDISGKIVQTSKITSSTEFNLSKSGTYFVTITKDEKTYNEKIVVE